ncbi:MAG: cation diffusion facilitator family transporter, partial [Candidatus Cybelea sp.]
MAATNVTRPLSFALLATALVALLEFWGGAVSRSLALTGDAVHVCMDVVALALALVASAGAARPADPRRTFGYGRIEVLGALVNGTILLVATLGIVYFAARRFAAPVEPHAGVMTIVAAIGLAVNAGVGFSLRAPGKRDMNVRAALFHVAGDALGAVAVIAGGIAIGLTHVVWIDPLLSLFVAAIIVVGVVRLMRDATEV